MSKTFATAPYITILRADLNEELQQQYALYLQIDRLVKAGPPAWETWLNTEIAYYDLQQLGLNIRALERQIAALEKEQTLQAA